jgi:hypothetical protein
MLNWKSGSFAARTGGFSCIAVEPSRSSTGKTLVGFNVDQPVHSLRPLSIPNAAEIVRTDHLYSAWMDGGQFIILLGRRPLARPDRLLQGCRCPHRLARRIHDSTAGAGFLIVATPAEILAWCMERCRLRMLQPTEGLFTFSAGHSSADPLPGGGWLIEKLERLRHANRISPLDVERTLHDAELGDSTVQTLMIDPSARSVERLDRDSAPGGIPLRRSA